MYVSDRKYSSAVVHAFEAWKSFFFHWETAICICQQIVSRILQNWRKQMTAAAKNKIHFFFENLFNLRSVQIEKISAIITHVQTMTTNSAAEHRQTLFSLHTILVSLFCNSIITAAVCYLLSLHSRDYIFMMCMQLYIICNIFARNLKCSFVIWAKKKHMQNGLKWEFYML